MGDSHSAMPEAATVLTWAREVFDTEGQAVMYAADRLSESFCEAVSLLLSCRGRVVLTGIGKSGNIAQKIASTLSSTGTPAFFLHPSEAMHGDFGMMGAEDALLALSYGGETREVVGVARYAKGSGLRVISILGNLTSSLAMASDVTLDGGVLREADTLGLAPTASSTVALVLGDALAVALMRSRGFSRENFAQLHPGGNLGRASLLVRDVMHGAPSLSSVTEGASFRELLVAVSSPNFGIVPVVDPLKGLLLGAVSDGDLRRALLTESAEAFQRTAGDVMNRMPKTISPEAHAVDGIALMERYKITALFVVAGEVAETRPRLLGLVRLHDLLAARVV